MDGMIVSTQEVYYEMVAGVVVATSYEVFPMPKLAMPSRSVGDGIAVLPPASPDSVRSLFVTPVYDLGKSVAREAREIPVAKYIAAVADERRPTHRILKRPSSSCKLRRSKSAVVYHLLEAKEWLGGSRLQYEFKCMFCARDVLNAGSFRDFAYNQAVTPERIEAILSFWG